MLLSFLMILSTAIATNSSEPFRPVIYVVFGVVPMYLRINVELASRKNPVVILSDVYPIQKNSFTFNSTTYPVVVEDSRSYNKLAGEFAQVYRHYSRDNSVTQITRNALYSKMDDSSGVYE